jgi:hypothetical protein
MEQAPLTPQDVEAQRAAGAIRMARGYKRSGGITRADAWAMEELRIQAKLYGHEPGVHTPRTATSPARFGTTVEHIDVGPIKHIGILD